VVWRADAGASPTETGSALVGTACVDAGVRPAATEVIEFTNWPTTPTAKAAKAMVVLLTVVMTSRRTFVRKSI
jgi:hypothetical protein